MLSDVYYPGWQARIDGKPTMVYQTDYVLRGVALPAGDHVVDFEFRPLGFDIGLVLSAISMLILMTVVAYDLASPRISPV